VPSVDDWEVREGFKEVGARISQFKTVGSFDNNFFSFVEVSGPFYIVISRRSNLS
jgi:hypothetical protein